MVWRRPPPPAPPPWLLVIALAAGVALTTGAPGQAVSALTRMRWASLPPLVLLSLLNFVLSAVALRGAAGRPIPLYETTLARFTAAAANRVTPSGLGVAAVNTRFLVCQGIPLSRAAIAVTLLQVAGLPADLARRGRLDRSHAGRRARRARRRHRARAAGRPGVPGGDVLGAGAGGPADLPDAPPLSAFTL